MGVMNVMEIGEEAMLPPPLHWVSVLLETDLFSFLSCYLAICFLTLSQTFRHASPNSLQCWFQTRARVG